MSDIGPFEGDVEEVPLERSPLATVLAQVKFPKAPALSNTERVLELLRLDYPILRSQPALTLALGQPSGPAVLPAPGITTLNVFSDIAGSHQVTIADDAITLQTIAYSSREEFVGRFAKIVGELLPLAKPPLIDRIGVRYINQISDSSILQDIKSLLRPEVLAGLSLPETEGIKVEHTLVDSQFSVHSNGFLRFRSGLIPAGAAVDPGVPVNDQPSFLLDMDCSVVGSLQPDATYVASEVRRLAESAYRFFRWAITPKFLRTFGGRS